MSSKKTQSRDVARLLEQTAARAFKMPMEEILPAFNEVEATCLAQVSSKELQLEVKRRVAEWKMRLLCDRNASFRIVEQLHDDVLNLGYSHLENEGTIEIYFAQYCIRQNQADVARRILQQLCSKLDNALKTDNLEVYRHFRQVSEELLSKII